MKIQWQTAPYTTYASARIADVNSDRLHVHRLAKRSRVFVGKINGVSAITADNIDAACSSLAKYYRQSREDRS